MKHLTIAHARFSPLIPLVTRLSRLAFSSILGHASLIRDGRGQENEGQRQGQGQCEEG